MRAPIYPQVRCDQCGASVHVHEVGPVQETCVDRSEAIISYLCPGCYMKWRGDEDEERDHA